MAHEGITLLTTDLELSVRAANVLFNADLNTVEDVRFAITSGKLLRVRNCGRATFNEICNAVGLSRNRVGLRERNETRVWECPHCNHSFRITTESTIHP